MRRRALLLSALLLACREQDAPAIRIVLGPSPDDEVSLVPRSSLAEYIEISPSETHLLLTFSSSPRSCDGATEPDRDAVTLSVRILLVEGERLATGSFAVLGGEAPKGTHATSTVKLRGRRRELLPGGSVELRALELAPRGSVEGMLKLEFPGDHRAPATRVSGAFKAYFCRINRLR